MILGKRLRSPVRKGLSIINIEIDHVTKVSRYLILQLIELFLHYSLRLVKTLNRPDPSHEMIKVKKKSQG